MLQQALKYYSFIFLPITVVWIALCCRKLQVSFGVRLY
jgi:hypothetical protein